MMFRTLLLFAALTAAFAQPAGAEPPVIKPGEDLTVNLAATHKIPARGAEYKGQLANGKTASLVISSGHFMTEVAVELKAGQSLPVTATVVGKDRHVYVVLFDPSGAALEGTDSRLKAAKMTFDEVSAAGTYRIAVISDRVGELTLSVGGSGDGLSVKALEEKIAKLKRELAEAEEQLKKARAKK